MTKEIKVHRKNEQRIVWQAGRMEDKVRNAGINPVKKSKKAA